MINISKRRLTHLIAFPTAIIAALTIMLFMNGTEAEHAKRALENNYMRAAGELSRSLENIKNTLNKGMYSNSPAMMSELSIRLNNDAMAAKANLAQLPVSDLNLINTNRFLSQVGNYSKALSERAANDEELTAEDRGNLVKLYDYAAVLSESMWDNGRLLRDGAVPPPDITDGFKEMEDTFDDYPMLIYDGPFSDHIMQKEPLMLKNANPVSGDEAFQFAVFASGISSLVFMGEEEGRMPSYIFGNGNTTVAVTKAGGYLSYMLGYRAVESERITAEQAADSAGRFLEKLGITDITGTYYETRDGICIINFAGIQGNVTLYTDLIKVGVAMDTGEILSVDARGWLVNHTKRKLGEPLLSEQEAAALLSPLLTAEGAKLCVIPSDGMKERFCYEFRCSTEKGRQVLIYINADTGREERILLLEISNNGTLTV
ncbi:MAG: germination protein YpeB [Oscillospiraceae bacterium]|nr:germination protein YpeB [Oscillospiraceae bacterium]